MNWLATARAAARVYTSQCEAMALRDRSLDTSYVCASTANTRVALVRGEVSAMDVDVSLRWVLFSAQV